MYPLTAPQEMGDQFLGRGLSSAPRDRHDGKGAAAKALGRHVEQRLAGVLDHDDGRTIDPLGWPLTENAGGAALKGLRDEDVAVMLPAPERDKQPAWFYLPRVGK